MTGTIAPDPLSAMDLVLASGFVLASAGASLLLSLGVHRTLMWSAIRMVAQLLVVGFLLRIVFGLASPWVTALTVAAMIAAAALGAAFERIIVRPVYGKHVEQILITMGGGIIGEELIKVIWGPSQIPLPLPEALRGAVALGDASLSRYRILAVVTGAAVFAALAWTLNRTKVGLLVRAGVQDREMVEALGYRIGRMFVGVFVTGSALAGLGGGVLYQRSCVKHITHTLLILVLIFIVIII